MEFLKMLVEKNFKGTTEKYEEESENSFRVRQFEPIRLQSDLWLSIQASCAHFCKPRKTFLDLKKYSHWEVALFDSENFVRVTDVLPEFSSLAEIELYEEGVYSYLPADLVEELYLDLKKVLQVADK